MKQQDLEQIRQIWAQNPSPQKQDQLTPSLEQCFPQVKMNCKVPSFEPNNTSSVSFTDNNTTCDDISDCSSTKENSHQRNQIKSQQKQLQQQQQQQFNTPIPYIPNVINQNQAAFNDGFPIQQQQQQNPQFQMKHNFKGKHEMNVNRRSLKYRPDRIFGNKELEILYKNNENFEGKHDKAEYYVLKSFSMTDLYYSIKYGIMCTSNFGNKKLNDSYIKANQQHPIYLIFNVKGTGEFQGIARMNSPVDFNTYYEGWTINKKWVGLFALEWVFIKDIHSELCISQHMSRTEVIQMQNINDILELNSTQGEQFIDLFKQFKQQSITLKRIELDSNTPSNDEQKQKSQITQQKSHLKSGNLFDMIKLGNQENSVIQNNSFQDNQNQCQISNIFTQQQQQFNSGYSNPNSLLNELSLNQRNCNLLNKQQQQAQQCVFQQYQYQQNEVQQQEDIGSLDFSNLERIFNL